MEEKQPEKPQEKLRPEDIMEKKLVSWRAPTRPFKKRSREFYSTVGVIVLLLAIILFFAREFLLIGVLLSLMFFAYALASVPPGDTDYILTNKGLYVGAVFYPFELLGRFWFEEKWHQQLVMFEHFGGFPNVITAVLSDNQKEVEKILGEYMLQQKPTPTVIDNAAKWLADKIPLES